MQVKLLTKYSLLTDCQRRARQLSGALKTATAQVLIALRTSCDADILSQQIKQWTSVKHELVKNLQNEEKMPERSRFVIFIVIVSFALSCTTMNCCFVVSMYQKNPFPIPFQLEHFYGILKYVITGNGRCLLSPSLYLQGTQKRFSI